MSSSPLRAPLRRSQFRRLAVSYAVNEIGDWLGLIALSILVYDQTGSALATASLFLGTRFAPALIAPLVAARFERPAPRFALPVIYCGQAACFCALALIAAHFSLVAIVALAVVDGALALTGRALTRSVTASLLGPTGELRAGNAILNISFTAAAAIGPAVAGLVVSGFGIQTALLLDAVSFYAIAWVLLGAGDLPRAEVDAGSLMTRVRAGLAYIARLPQLRNLLIAQAGAFIFFAIVLPIEVIYAKETLDAGNSGYGVLLASWGGGMVLGSILFALLRRGRLGHLLVVSTTLVGVAYLGLAAAPTLAVACAVSALGGTGNGIQWVSLISAVQEMTADRMQARVMSVLESIGAAMPGIGFLIGGLVTEGQDPRAAYVVAGAGVLLVVFVGALVIAGSRARGAAGNEEYGCAPRKRVTLD